DNSSITLIIKIYYFCNSVVSPTVRAEAKTIIRENTLKDRCKNLGHSLLNHSVHHCWYSEFSYSTIRLRNFYPFDWCWFILALTQTSDQFRLIFSEIWQKVIDCHIVNACCPFISPNSQISLIKVSAVQDSFLASDTHSFTFIILGTTRPCVLSVFQTYTRQAVSLLFCFLRLSHLITPPI